MLIFNAFYVENKLNSVRFRDTFSMKAESGSLFVEWVVILLIGLNLRVGMVKITASLFQRRKNMGTCNVTRQG